MPAGRPRTPEADRPTCLTIRLAPADLANARRIETALRRRGKVPGLAPACRWALRELAARLDLPAKAGGLPVVGDGGPITQP